MSISKNREEVRLNSGDDFQIYVDSAWITLGHIVSGRLSYQSESQEVVYADGNAEDFRGKRKGTLSVVLAQVSKEILDQVDTMDGKSLMLYYFNGIAHNGTLNAEQALEFVVPEARIVNKMELDMRGQSHQNIPLEFSLSPSDTGVAEINTADLPETAYAFDDTPGEGELIGVDVDGYNPFWIVFETLVPQA